VILTEFASIIFYVSYVRILMHVNDYFIFSLFRSNRPEVSQFCVGDKIEQSLAFLDDPIVRCSIHPRV
jgi:hypothetical protein